MVLLNIFYGAVGFFVDEHAESLAGFAQPAGFRQPFFHFKHIMKIIMFKLADRPEQMVVLVHIQSPQVSNGKGGYGTKKEHYKGKLP